MLGMVENVMQMEMNMHLSMLGSIMITMVKEIVIHSKQDG